MDVRSFFNPLALAFSHDLHYYSQTTLISLPLVVKLINIDHYFSGKPEERSIADAN